jgi:hypothetical protein
MSQTCLRSGAAFITLVLLRSSTTATTTTITASNLSRCAKRVQLTPEQIEFCKTAMGESAQAGIIQLSLPQMAYPSCLNPASQRPNPPVLMHMPPCRGAQP